MKKILLVIIFLTVLHLKSEEIVEEKFEARTIRSIGMYYENIMLDNPGYNNFFGINWSEYAKEPDSKYFVPFYNLNLGYSNFQDKHWYQLTIAPGFRIRFDNNRGRTSFFKDITFFDIELSTGITSITTNKNDDDHYVGLASSFGLIFGFKYIQIKVNSSVYVNMPYTSSQSFVLSYLF